MPYAISDKKKWKRHTKGRKLGWIKCFHINNAMFQYWLVPTFFFLPDISAFQTILML